ncbi:MAG: isoprenylcysteine carboxylmethyltransferase family protein [Gammaproteobacteria bacterium]
MKSLELRIPPPLVLVAIAAAMWFISRVTPVLEVPTPYRKLVALVVAVAGGFISYRGVSAFRLAQTTPNPMKPDEATVLVSSGIYRFTRNPMYLGLLFILLAWSIFLAAPWVLLGPFAFVLFIGRFQIRPEEAALSRLFGADYADYKAKVRRWL